MPYFPPITRPSHLGGSLFEAFLNGINTSGSAPTGPLAFSSSSSGAAASVGSQAPPDNVSFGVVFLSTGSTTTGRAGIFSSLTAIRFGSIPFRTRARFQFPSLLDGTESGAIYIGFDDLNTGAPADGAYLYWDNTQTNFRYRTRNNSTETDVDSGLAPAATTWYEVEIAVNAAGSSVAFTINDANLQTITTNIPTAAGRETALGANIIKSAGTTTRAILLDDWAFSWGNAA